MQSQDDLRDDTADKARGMSLRTAISEQEPDGIRAAAARGEILEEGEDPIMLVARGINVNELNHQYHQSAETVGNTLEALKEIGVDLNQEQDGRPAAHRVTKFYGRHLILNHFDTSGRGAAGISDLKQAERLAAFARAGIDFEAKDEKGRRPFEMLEEMGAEAAERHGEDPSKLQAYLFDEYGKVRTAAREYRVKSAAREDGARSERQTPRSAARSGPSLDD